MITTNANKSSVTEMKKKAAAEKAARIKQMCEELANSRYGADKVAQLSNANKGLWFLPVMDEEETTIEALALMKPIDRHILSYASTKIEGEGLYAFLEACMRECAIPDHYDECILDDDEFFIPAANSFNKILEGKKATLLKR